MQILNRVLLNTIGVHIKNFAAVQNQIALTVKYFVLGVTGNGEVNKDVLNKQSSYIQVDGKTICIPFIKRVLKHVNMLERLDLIEDRFLPDGDKHFLIQIVESLSKGQLVHVSKVKALPPSLPVQASSATGRVELKS